VIGDEATPVGLVGLGAMGAAFAERLLAAGHELAVYDTRAEAVEPLADRVEVHSSPAAVARRAGTVLVSLPTPDVVASVVGDGEGLLAGGMTTFIDLSTTGVKTAREIGSLLAESVSYLDAPVSGGVAGAEAGTLGIFAAGDDDVFERCRPLLEPFASKIVHVGAEPGQGQLAKVLNNLVSATAMTITSEALAAGVSAGLDPDSLLEAFNSGSGRNTATTAKFPEQVVTRRFASGFRLELMLKDVRLALEAAREERAPMLLGGLVEQLWALAAGEGDAATDHTEIARLYERWAGVTIESGQGAVGANG
jgi:3-hydroxyisobutyrate dehydrogenase-like beta-hydroxyacid dehydrogenase